jgi:hypothetical protein
MRLHRFWIGALILLLLALSWPAYAQEAITVVLDEHEHAFKESITFRLSARSADKITSVKLFYREGGQTASHKVELEFEPATSVELEHVEDMADQGSYRPPMISYTYWWLIENENGDRLKIDPVSFVYEDTRYNWEVLEGNLVRLYWHDQDQAFGQGYYDLAVAAAEDLSAEFGVSPKDPVPIVIYNSHDELMSALQEASKEWTGAVTFGEWGCVLIGLGSASWMEVVIPHELTHAILYMVTKPPFGGIPTWLHEGLAVRSEGGMSVEERTVLDEAIREDTLISLRVLNSPFADAREQAILSYAESNSLINFIIEEYGAEKLGELIAVFAEGAHYDDAMMEVFGVDMDGMEDLWREYIGAQPRSGVTRATPVPTATSQPQPTATLVPSHTPTAASEPAPIATATAVAVVPTPTATRVAEQLPVPTPTPVPRSAAPCLGAVPALAVLILFFLFRPQPRR